MQWLAAASGAVAGDAGFWWTTLFGVVLAAFAVWLRGRGKLELKLADVAIGSIPLLFWLVASGQVQKLGFAGVELEVREAILAATSEPVQAQVTSVEGIVDRIESGERGAKGAVDLLPELLRQRIEALEFRLGRGDYYVASAIQRYLEALGSQAFFRYVLVFDEQGRLFGMFDEASLLEALGGERDGYERFAALLNRGGEEAGRELSGLPGFVSGAEAMTPGESKRLALTRMERLGSSVLPVVEPESGKLLGVVERDRLTASLILDIAGELENGK